MLGIVQSSLYAYLLCSKQLYKLGAFAIAPTLQRRKLKPRETNGPTQDHPVSVQHNRPRQFAARRDLTPLLCYVSSFSLTLASSLLSLSLSSLLAPSSFPDLSLRGCIHHVSLKECTTALADAGSDLPHAFVR